MSVKLEIDLTKSTQEVVEQINTYLMRWTYQQRKKLITYLENGKQEMKLSGVYVNNIGYPYLCQENALETNLQQLLARFTNNALDGVFQLHKSMNQQEEINDLKQIIEQEKALKTTAFSFILKQNKFEEFADFLNNTDADQTDHIWENFNTLTN